MSLSFPFIPIKTLIPNPSYQTQTIYSEFKGFHSYCIKLSIPMAQERMKMGMVLVIMSILCAGAAAQSSSCSSALVSLSPCLNYIAGNSSTPSSGCCSQLASVVSSQPQCLCEVLNGGASSLGITINQTQALALPTACNVQTPPITQCKGKIKKFTQITQNHPP